MEGTSKMQAAWRRHERRWGENRFVYAVVSRRSGGVSVGVNLNPDKACNFDCIYCQVNRAVPPVVRRVELQLLSEELDRVLEAERDGSLYESSPFDALLPVQRGLRDIAFSGDGEPTTYPRFLEAVRIAAEARQRFGLTAAKLVLITDAAYLAKPVIRAALQLLDAHNGEIWAKLDAGTDEYFRLVDRPNVSLQIVLDNILNAARVRPVVIQSLWMRVRNVAPPEQEIAAYCSRLNTMLQAGGRLKAIQLYTIARDPAVSYVSPLPDAALDRLAAIVSARVPVAVETYYGIATPGGAER